MKMETTKEMLNQRKSEVKREVINRFKYLIEKEKKIGLTKSETSEYYFYKDVRFPRGIRSINAKNKD